MIGSLLTVGVAVAGLAVIYTASPLAIVSQVGELTQALWQVRVDRGLDPADGAVLPRLPLGDLLGPWLPLLRGCR